MTIKLHRDLIQGSEEWHAARCGLLTASEMRFILTPAKLQYAKGAETHLKELASQRITQYVEPGFVSDDMLRGHEMEGPAKLEYERSEGVMVQDDVAFITNDEWGFTLGYSPDGLVGDDGLIEIKAPRQKGQFGNIIDGVMPDEFRIQVQTGMLVSGRDWCDFISYCAGMPMMVLRVYPDEIVQEAIIKAAKIFHEELDEHIQLYAARLKDKNFRLIPTKPIIEEEIHV